jgi:23S rRNA (uracil1939-C5)-methyltransferase
LPGERVLVRYLFGRSQQGKVETLEVLQPDKERVEPRCPHFGNCGGCSLQHLSPKAQILRKQATLLDLLESSAGVKPAEIYAPLQGPQWNYRRKARLSVRDVSAKGRVLVGFRERNGRYVADMSECHVLHQEIADLLPALSTMLGSLESSALVPQIEVACGDEQCALIIRHLEELPVADVQTMLEFARQNNIALYLQSKGPETVQLIEGLESKLEYGIPSLGLRFGFEPLDFLQVNGELNREMLTRALELLDPQANDRVLDLFCGLGNFTLALATRAGHVTGIEGSSEMVHRAATNAGLNGLSNVDFHAVDLYKAGESSPWPAGDYNKILLDPPRSGALDLLPWIGASDVQQVLYISCNPETLSRDAGLLVHEHGFELKGAGILNMFPHTAHSEAIALFERHTSARPES